MKSSLPSATKAEKRRFDIITREIGCIACRQKNIGCVPAEAHHLLSGGKRISHSHTVPLCTYHHRGHGWRDKAVFGPSLAHGSKAFHHEFGSDEELLAMTNKLVEAFERNTVGRCA